MLRHSRSLQVRETQGHIFIASNTLLLIAREANVRRETVPCDKPSHNEYLWSTRGQHFALSLDVQSTLNDKNDNTIVCSASSLLPFTATSTNNETHLSRSRRFQVVCLAVWYRLSFLLNIHFLVVWHVFYWILYFDREFLHAWRVSAIVHCASHHRSLLFIVIYYVVIMRGWIKIYLQFNCICLSVGSTRRPGPQLWSQEVIKKNPSVRCSETIIDNLKPAIQRTTVTSHCVVA